VQTATIRSSIGRLEIVRHNVKRTRTELFQNWRNFTHMLTNVVDSLYIAIANPAV